MVESAGRWEILLVRSEVDPDMCSGLPREPMRLEFPIPIPTENWSRHKTTRYFLLPGFWDYLRAMPRFSSAGQGCAWGTIPKTQFGCACKRQARSAPGGGVFDARMMTWALITALLFHLAGPLGRICKDQSDRPASFTNTSRWSSPAMKNLLPNLLPVQRMGDSWYLWRTG